MKLASVFRKLATASALATVLFAPGLANAANSYGDNVTCAGAYTSCYDFTVYDGVKITANSTGTPAVSGFFEGFVGYTGSGTVVPYLTNAYFISSGLASPGATVSSWASYISNPVMYGSFDPITGVQSGTASLTTTGGLAGRFAGTNTNNITFQVGSTYYAVVLAANGSATLTSSAISAEDALATGSSLSARSFYYTSTNTGANSLNTTGAGSFGNFGGQIAPEMSPLMSFNVFALLGCLFLLFSSRKYFAKTRSDASSALSIA